MLLVETYLDFSPGRGLGLFAKVNILKGQKYWIRNETFDRKFSDFELRLLDKVALEYIKRHGFLEVSRDWYLCGDNARFSNHSKQSNSTHHFNKEGLLEYCTVSEDIYAGSEIFCDYTEICLTCKNGVSFEEV